ncbi:hypothetical protein [Pseudomonas mandelii]
MKGLVAYLFFLAAFPGYFFYHALKSTTLIPYIGWFSSVLIVCTIVWIAWTSGAVIKSKHIRIAPIITFPFWVLILLMSLTIVINQTSRTDAHITIEGAAFNSLLVIWMIALFQIGRNIELKYSVIFTVTIGLITIAFFFGAINFYNVSTRVMFLPLLDGDIHEAANYQGMARSVMCTAVLLFPFIKQNWYRCTLTTMTIITLYLIGSRTELILFASTLPIFVFIHHRKYFAKLLALLALLLAIAVTISGTDMYRTIELYISSDPSLAERVSLFRIGFAGVTSNPIFGDYLGQVRDFGATGFYIHNILSMWQQFGILGLLLYIYLILVSVQIAWDCLTKGNITPQSEALIYLTIASVIGVITTKSIFWPIPALAWGLAANIASRQISHRKKEVKVGEAVPPHN